MKLVYNSINPGFKWAQAFDFPAGFLQVGDTARMEFRQTPLSAQAIASVDSLSGGIWFDGNRMFVYLDDPLTEGWAVSEVVTNIVVVRDDEEIPLGQIFHVPVLWLPTRASGSRDTAIVQGQERPIRVSVANGVPISLGLVEGVPGPPGKDGTPGTSLQFLQATSSAVWIIAHNLGFRPSVSSLSTGGREMNGQVDHLSENVLTISFIIPVAGSAHLV